jgi:hypothetical protein
MPSTDSRSNGDFNPDLSPARTYARAERRRNSSRSMQDPRASYRSRAEVSVQSPKISSADQMLTRQVLSIVTIRLGGGCAAPRRQIKLTLTAAFESPIPQSINEGGGDSGVRCPL